MRFNRRAPGGGMEVACRMENGRAFLRWEFHLIGADGGSIFLTLRDQKGETVLFCMEEPGEEEPLETVLLHPHFWSCDSPYLYEAEAFLVNREGKAADCLRQSVPVYELCYVPGKGWRLNGEEIRIRAAEYRAPAAIPATVNGGGAVPAAENSGVDVFAAEPIRETALPARRQKAVWRDLRMLKEMGANCLRTGPSLRQIVLRLGFLPWERKMEIKGEKCLSCPLGWENGLQPFLYYRYRAEWGGAPFVHIAPEKVRILPSGRLELTVYSSGSRVALYSDGELFEFQTGDTEFVFREVPAKGPCVLLCAEGDECSMSLSFHKTYLK